MRGKVERSWTRIKEVMRCGNGDERVGDDVREERRSGGGVW